jgi:hypothetical protein
MKQLIAAKDKYSTPLWLRELSDQGYTGRVAADTDIYVDVPVGSQFAIITASDNFFVASSAITLPTAGHTVHSNTEMNLEGIWITTQTKLYLKGRTAFDFSISFWG